MSKIGIYPGTFDPITYGHIDLIKKSLKVVDKLIVAISEGTNKNYLFSIEERLSIVKNALFKDLNFNKKKYKLYLLIILLLVFVKNIKLILY